MTKAQELKPHYGGSIVKHQMISTEFIAATNDSLDSVKATCACSFSVWTTLGASDFNRTDSFAKKELLEHINYMENR